MSRAPKLFAWKYRRKQRGGRSRIKSYKRNIAYGSKNVRLTRIYSVVRKCQSLRRLQGPQVVRGQSVKNHQARQSDILSAQQR